MKISTSIKLLSAFVILLLFTNCILFLPNGFAQRGHVPDELVGAWQTSSLSGIIYKDPSTGTYSDPSGTIVIYRFFADGRFEYSALMQQTMYNCTTKLFTYKTGKAVAEDGALTLVPNDGKFTSQDNCNARFNYEKAADLDRETYQWSIERDEYGIKVCLQNSDVKGCAYKKEE